MSSAAPRTTMPGMTGRAGVPASRASSSNAVEMASRTSTRVRSQCAASKLGGTCICARGERGSQVGDHRTRTALAHIPHTRVYPCGRARIPESRAVHAKHTSAYHRHDPPTPPRVPRTRCNARARCRGHVGRCRDRDGEASSPSTRPELRTAPTEGATSSPSRSTGVGDGSAGATSLEPTLRAFR